MPTPSSRTPVKIARGSYSDLNGSISDLQEGEIVYAQDQDACYVKEGSSLVKVKGDVADAQITTAKIADDAVTADKLANSINTEIAANTAKTTNATHTGEVTGATALTIADNIVDEANLKVDNSPTDDYVLTAKSSASGGLTWAAASGGGGGGGGGLSSDSERNTVGGSNAGDSFDGSSAADNSLYGYDCGTAITTADKNSLYGSKIDALTTGSYNTCVGMEAGAGLTTSSYGVYVGYEAGKTYSTENQFGASALCVGGQAGKNSTGVKNTFIGTKCAQSSGSGQQNCYMGNETAGTRTGSFNVGIGGAAFPTGGDGSNCVGLGFYVFSGLTSGSDNTAIGDNAGGLTTGSNCTLLGHDAAASSNTVSNEITLGDSNISSLRCQVTSITSLSDRRDKTDINTLDLGLDFIDSLKPVKFKWETRDGKGPKGYEAGFIAQDFQQVQKEYDADYLNLVLESNPEKLEAAPSKLIPIMIKAIQELKMEIETLKNNG